MSVHGFYEPWCPLIGQRVRIRVSQECRVRPTDDSPQGLLGDLGHGAWEDGLTGIIGDTEGDPIEEELVRQGHRFLVWWDRPQPYAGVMTHGATYAATELEPLDPAAPPTAPSGGDGGAG